MAKFLKGLVTEHVDGKTHRLFTDLEYHVGSPDSEETILVPSGFLTDFASIPRIFWILAPKDGPWTPAAVLHDFMYQKHLYSRKRCDDIFKEAMKVCGVGWFYRGSIYNAVRGFGWMAW